MFDGKFVTNANAVEVRGGCKSYGKSAVILNNLNLTVEQGSIYAVLGASGCGKTTLLSCILSIQNLDSGVIRVFGQTPGSTRSGIPGSLVGYMPQDYSLYSIFSIYESLWYYGKLYGMGKCEIYNRISFLKSFLELPKLSRIINTLSGGQTRRVSMALAMIHNPKLLILDEPSVGLDPVLRESIWNYLRELVTKEAVTIIVTTHYISEAINCDKVGIMRNGKMIAEDCPKYLMEIYEGPTVKSLEDVVIKLCKKDEFDKQNINVNLGLNEVKIAKDENSFIGTQSYRRKTSHEFEKPVFERNQTFWKHPNISQMIYALACKNLLVLRRHWMLLSMLFIIPSLNCIMEETFIGKEPKGMVLNYVIGHKNQSQSFKNYCKRFKTTSSPGCFEKEHFPICNLLQRLDAKGVKTIQAPNEQNALGQVQNGAAIGYLKFDGNYSQHLQNRLMLKNFVSNESIDGTVIKLRIDMTSYIHAVLLKSIILEEYLNSLKDVVRSCGQDERQVEIPLKIDSLYKESASSQSEDYISYIRPSCVIMMMFVVGNFTGAIYVGERRLGVKHRGAVVGVKFSHQIAASLITDSAIIIIQTLLLFAIQSQIYGAVFKGSLTLSLLICYLSGISGLMFSIMLSEFAEDEIQMFTWLFFFNIVQLICTGGLWPMVSIPRFFRIVCYCLPLSFPLDSLRCVMYYGWGITHPNVLAGICTSIVWICGCGLIIWLVVMKKK